MRAPRFRPPWRRSSARDARAGSPVDRHFDAFVDRALCGRIESTAEFVAAREDLDAAGREQLSRRLGELFGPRRTGTSSELPFEVLGGYRLTERRRIHGGWVAFEARRLADELQVELLVLRPTADAVDEIRFDQLARSLPALRHPAVVPVLELGEERGLRFVASEPRDGASLDERLRRCGALPACEAARIALDLARALAAAHERGILHLAVEPANVLVTAEGRALLAAFGAAGPSRAAAAAAGATDSRSLPYQAAPEQMAARPAVDERTDVYSLGATLYRCLTGAEPFEAANAAQLARRVRRGAPIAPRARNPAVSRDLELVTLAALERRGEHRYRSADELARDLEAVLEARSIRPPPRPPISRIRRVASDRPRAAAAALIAAVALVAAAAATWLAGRGTARAFERELAAAISAESSGDLEAAVRAWDRALAIAPADRRALSGRISAQSRRDQGRAEEALAAARRLLATYRDRSEAARTLDDELAPLQLALSARPMTRDELARLFRGERRALELRGELEDTATQLVLLLDRARSFGAPDADVSALLAATHLERWRQAVARGDAAGERRLRERIERDDPSGAHAAELAGSGTLAIHTRPAGAQVSLFRFVEQAELSPDGDPRLVPVPVDGEGELASTPVAPGTWSLRVVRGRGDLRADDVIVRVAGHPVRDTVLLAEDQGELRALDRLVEIDGRPVHDVHEAAALADGGEARSLVFERAGETIALPAARADELGAPSLASLLSRRSVPVTVVRQGELLELASEPGLEVRLTAIPLLDVPACSAGKAPIASRRLARGSYLALVRLENFEPLRVPFTVTGGGETRLDLRLDEIGTAPDGFVFVHGGPARIGGDRDALAGAAPEVRQVDDFWIAEREVTESEYIEFLNDPRTRAEIDASPAPIRVPRDATAPAGLWKRSSDGAYLVPEPARELPVGSISTDDAHAYARWRTARSRSSGENLVYSLPTEAEWEKAARGADGRSFVFGARFSPQWTKCLFARERLLPGARVAGEPGLRFPIDESVYGVYDLTGSRCEPCEDAWAGARSTCTIRGGADALFAPASFRAASRSGARVDEPLPALGIRLVVRNARERGPSPLDR